MALGLAPGSEILELVSVSSVPCPGPALGAQRVPGAVPTPGESPALQPQLVGWPPSSPLTCTWDVEDATWLLPKCSSATLMTCQRETHVGTGDNWVIPVRGLLKACPGHSKSSPGLSCSHILSCKDGQRALLMKVKDRKQSKSSTGQMMAYPNAAMKRTQRSISVTREERVKTSGSPRVLHCFTFKHVHT